MPKRLTHIVGFDDAPFNQRQRGGVLVVGAVYAGLHLEGVLSGKVWRDGINSTTVLAKMVRDSRFRTQIHVVLLQGIAVAGFNVVDLDALHRSLKIPVIVVARRKPDFEAIRRALLRRVPGGQQKWRLIERAGPMEPVAGVYIQRRGSSLAEAEELLRRFAVHGAIPEPLRTAHIIAAGVTLGESRHRV